MAKSNVKIESKSISHSNNLHEIEYIYIFSVDNHKRRPDCRSGSVTVLVCVMNMDICTRVMVVCIYIIHNIEGWQPTRSEMFLKQIEDIMDTYLYQEVLTFSPSENKSRENNNSSKYFLRQMLVCSGVWTAYFVVGLGFGTPTVMIPQIRREANSTEAVSTEMASWLSSALAVGAIPWTIILPILASLLGRKRTFTFMFVIALTCFIVTYWTTNLIEIVACQVMHGIVLASAVTLTLMVATEYTSPKYRGIFLTIKSVSFAWGMFAANVIGTFYHWKNIVILGIVSSLYVLIIVFFWPNSPYWLAAKGRFEECMASHRWLKGSDEHSEKELSAIINSQKGVITQKDNLKDFLSRYIKVCFSKPILLSLLILAQYQSSGKIVCAVYAIDIIKKITDSESKAYAGMLILDGITISGMYIGCALCKFYNRRTLLFVSSSIAIVFLFLLSLYLYLINLLVITENNYVSISLMIAFSLTISSGPMVLNSSLCGEVLPVKSRTFALVLFGTFGNIECGIFLKVAPLIFRIFKLHGAFLIYGILTTILTFLLFKYLPETKDKTLQEIEDIMKSESKLKEERSKLHIESCN